MKQRITIFLIIILALSSCKSGKREADISNIKLDINIQRFDSAFWQLDTNNIAESFHQLLTQYPDITPIFTERIIQFGHPDSSITHETYKIFRKDTAVQHLYQDALTYYKDIQDIEQELSLAFRRAKYFFPKWETPNVYFHVSGFNNNIIVGEGFISLSIDNYMGAEYPIYNKTNIYKYQLVNMHRGKVVPDYITAWISTEVPSTADSDLLNDMIRAGKILYSVSVMLPEAPENLLIGYSEEQWNWVKENESNMWNTLILSKDLYSKQPLTKSRYLNDGPFTRPFTQDSPGRAGVFLGWQIVESYMSAHPEVTLEQLLYEPDCNRILNQSNYQP